MMFVKKRQEERYVQAVSLQVSAYAFPQILSASSLKILAVPPAWRLRRWGSAAMQHCTSANFCLKSAKIMLENMYT
jgi:hypothetical protein